MTTTSRSSTPAASDGLVDAAREFISGVDVASALARKWRCRAQLIEGATWAFHDDTGAIKAVGVLSPDDQFTIPGKHLGHAVAWAKTLGLNLVIFSSGKSHVIEAENIGLVLGATAFFVSPTTGFTADVNPVIKAHARPSRKKNDNGT